MLSATKVNHCQRCGSVAIIAENAVAHSPSDKIGTTKPVPSIMAPMKG
eukprot:CAMPEP_0204538830 /NCGR_PEP_ID=MMETSP0661-20131031/16300_1 /ASSEMBLY_ACC=CAM_ASM_000606 /TAXON_ID=109239 /ORGANISM="Alexandrium margalefi, Strain AMGDE01CS-322" /LENGTH=47 /DNA_ID= /DNA_START= /DNA_END= /DNA_ORIENTATION=